MGYDAIIIGDGIAGLGAALGLARYRKKILVIGKQGLRGASTPRAAGILDPFLEMNARSPLFTIARAAFRLYPAWLRGLGISQEAAGYKKTGMLYIAMNREEASDLRRRFQWQKKSGIAVRWLDATRILKREPAVSRRLRGGLFYPSIPRVQPEKLMKVLTRVARKKGIRIVKTKSSARLALSRNRVTGVKLGRHFLKSNVVVQAAGAWEGLRQNSRIRLPVKPVRGQILIVKKGKLKISTILHSMDGGYIVPWDRDTLLLGSTVEFAGFNPRVTSGGLQSIGRKTQKIASCLKGVKVVKTWAGLRPFPKDRLPIIGPASIQGLYLAGGYYRSGILIGGLAGELLAKAIVSCKIPLVLRPFSVTRFKNL